MSATMEELELEKEAAEKEREELQQLILKEKKKKEELEAKPSVKRRQKKEPVEEKKGENMVPWVEGVFINRENEGGILAFSYQGDRFAIKDGEMCDVPEYIADHLNNLTYKEFEWVRDGKDTYEGQQGTKQVKAVKKRCEFRITRRFERPKNYKIPRPERHRL